MQTVKTVFTILLCLSALTACGHKGPLYLEKSSATPETMTGKQTSADSANADDTEDDKKKKNDSFQ